MVTTFDVVGDAADPLGLLRGIREGLADGGVYVCVDANCSDRLEGNVSPLGARYQGFSVLSCMTTSLASEGAGLGTPGLHEATVRELSSQAGFASVRRVPIQSPLAVQRL